MERRVGQGKSRFRILAERWLGIFLGIVLIAGGTINLLLRFLGQPATGVVTLVRREGGQRADVQAGRYTYVVSYRFSLPDGRTVEGFTKQVGDGAYVKHPNTTVKVRYLNVFPALNALESETVSVVQVILIGVGLLLIWPIRRRAAPKRYRRARTPTG